MIWVRPPASIRVQIRSLTFLARLIIFRHSARCFLSSLGDFGGSDFCLVYERYFCKGGIIVFLLRYIRFLRDLYIRLVHKEIERLPISMLLHFPDLAYGVLLLTVLIIWTCLYLNECILAELRACNSLTPIAL